MNSTSSLKKWLQKQSVNKMIALILIISIVSSCNNSTGNNDIESKRDPENDVSSTPVYYKSPNASYRRDSLFIALTIWDFINNELFTFDFYKRNYIDIDKVSVDVDSIFYSPDSLKFLAFVIVTAPAADFKDKKNYSIGNSIIGYRLSKKDYWKIYNFDQFATGGFRKYNSIKRLFREYYLGDGRFKYDSEYIWDSISQTWASANFGYNLDQVHFWDSSVVWRKGARIPGYYNFETNGNVKPSDENPVIILPKLDYPDSILKMYK